MGLDNDYLQKIKKNKGKLMGNYVNSMVNYLAESGFNVKAKG
jgi:hypothetical protein